MSTNILEWMQEWIAQNCDGDWEHAQNFTITTIDNPGWSVTINLIGTKLQEEHFVNVHRYCAVAAVRVHKVTNSSPRACPVGLDRILVPS
jgi:hypothetical protein